MLVRRHQAHGPTARVIIPRMRYASASILGYPPAVARPREEKQPMNEKNSGPAKIEIGRRALLAVGAAGIATLALPAGPAAAADASAPVFVYVGSYTKDPPGGGSNNPVGI